jgi:hypothetical protein
VDIIGFLNDVTGGNLLFWKVVAATIVFLGAGTQVFFAARMYGKAGSGSQEASATVHRWIGRITLTLGIAVAISCIAGPAGPVTPARALFHSIFGTAVLVAIVGKFAILRVLRKGEKWLPVFGTTLFLCFAAVWATSVADYVTR